ncbi:unnamed protein product, partial [Adineta steineri]
MTCTQCTCAALMDNAVGWNCMTNNGTCQLISNYSSNTGYFIATINGSFSCQQLPPEPFLKISDTALTVSTEKLSALLPAVQQVAPHHARLRAAPHRAQLRVVLHRSQPRAAPHHAQPRVVPHHIQPRVVLHHFVQLQIH